MKHIDIVFDRAPGHDSPRFIEVENDEGRSISAGNWLRRDDGHWVLRITPEQLKVLMQGPYTTVEHKSVLDMLELCGELGGRMMHPRGNETYAQYLRRLLDFIARANDRHKIKEIIWNYLPPGKLYADEIHKLADHIAEQLELPAVVSNPVERMDPEFTGDRLHKLVIDIETAVGKNNAGSTPLGAAVTELAERAYRGEHATDAQASSDSIESAR